MFKPPITTSDIKATDFKHSAYFVGLGLCCHREKVVSEAVFLRQKVARLICLAPGGCSNTHSGRCNCAGPIRTATHCRELYSACFQSIAYCYASKIHNRVDNASIGS